MATKVTPEIEAACKDTLRAAVLMPDKQANAYVKEQAGLLFSQHSESLEAAELELLDAQKEVSRLSAELDDLRRERRKYDDSINDTLTTEEELYEK